MMGLEYKENSKFYENYEYCLIETMEEKILNFDEIKREHILTFYLSTLNQFGKIQDWTEVRDLAINDSIENSQLNFFCIKYKSSDTIKCE